MSYLCSDQTKHSMYDASFTKALEHSSQLGADASMVSMRGSWTESTPPCSRGHNRRFRALNVTVIISVYRDLCVLIYILLISLLDASLLPSVVSISSNVLIFSVHTQLM